jgi:hypothetical protein
VPWKTTVGKLNARKRLALITSAQLLSTWRQTVNVNRDYREVSKAGHEIGVESDDVSDGDTEDEDF